jgi:hypothetical protein
MRTECTAHRFSFARWKTKNQLSTYTRSSDGRLRARSAGVARVCGYLDLVLDTGAPVEYTTLGYLERAIGAALGRLVDST